jgi:hypothetical protein
VAVVASLAVIPWRMASRLQPVIPSSRHTRKKSTHQLSLSMGAHVGDTCSTSGSVRR